MARMTETSATPRTTPSSSLVSNLRTELMRSLPFSRMQAEHVDGFIASATQAYFAPGEVVLEPAQGPATAVLCIRQGSVTGRKGLAEATGQFEYEVGDLFPVGAALAGRAVTATYTANEDTFCLQLPVQRVQQIAQLSPPFADFLSGRVVHMLELSRRAAQQHWATQALAEQSLERRLDQLPAKTPLACPHTQPLAEALHQMHERRVGSVLVLGDDGTLCGILTRHDILGRVTLPQVPLDTPIGRVMSSPVHTLTGQHTLQDAALLMSRLMSTLSSRFKPSRPRLSMTNCFLRSCPSALRCLMRFRRPRPRTTAFPRLLRLPRLRRPLQRQWCPSTGVALWLTVWARPLPWRRRQTALAPLQEPLFACVRACSTGSSTTPAR
jgi:CBS domain-containing protein